MAVDATKPRGAAAKVSEEGPPGLLPVPHSPEILFLSGEDVAALFDPATAIESQRMAFSALGHDTAVLPDKLMVPNPADGSVAFCYAARLSKHSEPVSKFGSVNPANLGRGIPTISAVIVVLDAVTGEPIAFMDGTFVTTRRTAAASAVAVDLLAPPHATSVAVVGSGVQAREHVRLLTRVRQVKKVRMWSPSQQHRTVAANELADETGIDIRPAATAQEAVSGAEVVVLCTLSSTPVVTASWLSPGATVLSIGSIEPDRSEVGPDVVEAAGRVVVDDVETAAAHAGPIVQSLRSGVLNRDDLGGLGDVLVGKTGGRRSAEELVYYNSTGIGVQDAAAAIQILAAARARGLGLRLPVNRAG